MGGGMTGLSNGVAVVDGSGGIVCRLGMELCLGLSLMSYRFRVAVVVFLLLGVDGGKIGRWLIAGWVGCPCLLAMTYEVFQVLNGTHFSEGAEKASRSTRTEKE